MRKKSSLPTDVIDQWPEVFNEITVTAVPIAYLHSLRIIFKDGKVWNVNIAAHIKKHHDSDFEEHLEELIEAYEDVIEHIDFRLNVDKVKRDIIKKTNKFLKNKKR